MKMYNRMLALAAGAIATLGMLPVASLAHAAPLVGEAVAFPESGQVHRRHAKPERHDHDDGHHRRR